MKKLNLLILLSVLIANIQYSGYSQIDETFVTNLKSHIEFLSSTEMNGRSAGTPENQRAGEYIATKFKEFGLK